jgi:hypothetical protein
MSADRIGDLPDGLHVLFCGAGSSMTDPPRSGHCIAVIAGTTPAVMVSGKIWAAFSSVNIGRRLRIPTDSRG